MSLERGWEGRERLNTYNPFHKVTVLFCSLEALSSAEEHNRSLHSQRCNNDFKKEKE